MSNKNYFYEENENKASLGQFGLRVLTGSSIAGEYFAIIEADVDSVFSCDILPNENGEIGDTAFTNFTLEKGRMKYGRFTNIVVTSGQVTAYKG